MVTEQGTASGPRHDTAVVRSDPGGVTPPPRVLALAAAALLSVGVPLIASAGLSIPGRPVLAVAFMSLVPGVPIALALRLPSVQATVALAVAASFSYQVIYGTFAIIGDFWHPIAASWIATVICLGFTAIALRQERQRTARPAISWRDRVDALVRDRIRLGYLGLVVAALFWWWETRTIRLDDAAEYGLFQVITWRYVVALIVLSAVTLHTLLRSRCDHLALTFAAALWALIGYATVPTSDGHGNVPTGWVHVAFIQYISEHGSVPASYDARFSWPGFFAAGAQLVSLGGTVDARSFLLLAPVVYFLGALPGLLLIARSITHSWRWSWVAVFIFVVSNWYQQDYFSPQATAFVIYVAILGTLLWMIDTSEVPRLEGNLATKVVAALKRTPALPVGMNVRTAQGLGILLTVLCAAMVVDHQLTPFTLSFALVAFAVTGLTRYRLLWLTASLILVGYFSYGALDFWIGHLGGLLGDVGKLRSALNSSVGGRLVGDPTYQSNQYVRIGWSSLLFASGAIGVWTLRRRREALLLAALACVPFALLAVQSYGGEVIIRSFLYASPMLAPLAASALRSGVGLLRSLHRGHVRGIADQSSRTTWIWTAGLLPVVVVAGLVMTFTRGLNASFERTPPEQVAASLLLYDLAQPGDAVAMPLYVGLTPYLEILDIPTVRADNCAVRELTSCLAGSLPRFVLVTLTQDRLGELTRNRPEGWAWAAGQQLIDSGQYTPIYHGDDAWLLELTSRTGT